MSVMTPVLMRVSDRISRLIGRILPSYVKIASSLVNRTIGKIMLPSSLKLFQRTRRTEVALISYFVLLVALMVTNGPIQLIVLLTVLLTTAYIYTLAEVEFRTIVKTCNYDNLGVTCRDPRHISRFISSFITVALVAIVLVTYSFTLLWWSSLVVLLFYLVAVLILMRRTSAKVRSPSTNLLILDRPKAKKETRRDRRKARKAERGRAAIGTIATKGHRKDAPLPPMGKDSFSDSSDPEPYTWPEGEPSDDDDEKKRWGRL
jgi:hypothetical protein